MRRNGRATRGAHRGALAYLLSSYAVRYARVRPANCCKALSCWRRAYVSPPTNDSYLLTNLRLVYSPWLSPWLFNVEQLPRFPLVLDWKTAVSDYHRDCLLVSRDNEQSVRQRYVYASRKCYKSPFFVTETIIKSNLQCLSDPLNSFDPLFVPYVETTAATFNVDRLNAIPLILSSSELETDRIENRLNPSYIVHLYRKLEFEVDRFAKRNTLIE